MYRFLLQCAAVGLMALLAPTLVSAAKKGGLLRVYQYDSPASMSIHEEALNSAQNPIMAVFNNLVIFKQDVPQNRMDTIAPDLATKWSWNTDMTELTFQLRHGVSWHDGKPLTAADVKCTWDLILGKGTDKLRANPRKAWYRNLEAISTKGDTVTFRLKRRQPAFIALIASGYSPFTHVTYRPRRCGSIQSAPDRSNSFPTNRTKPSSSNGMHSIGRKDARISTVSNGR
jgi:peptide/nickel transport system substrate-binding protein